MQRLSRCTRWCSLFLSAFAWFTGSVGPVCSSTRSKTWAISSRRSFSSWRRTFSVWRLRSMRLDRALSSALLLLFARSAEC